MSDSKFEELRDRGKANFFNFSLNGGQIAKLSADKRYWRSQARPGWDIEILDGVAFTHQFVNVPHDYDGVSCHYITCGLGQPKVFLHGIADSWYMCHHQMAALSDRYLCVAVDLNGYERPSKEVGVYTYEGASE